MLILTKQFGVSARYKTDWKEFKAAEEVKTLSIHVFRGKLL